VNRVPVLRSGAGPRRAGRLIYGFASANLFPFARWHAALAAGLIFSAATAQDARSIVKKADERSRGNTSRGEVVVRIVRPDWSREMAMQIWSKGNDRALIRLTAPARDRGIAFLKRGKEVWNWIPSIERSIKLPPSMMSQSWMGTDFTNDDLVKEASIVEDYDHALAGADTLLNRACYRIELTPRPEAAVVWSRVVVWIDRRDYLLLRAEYFDEDGALVSTLVAESVALLGGRLLPNRLSMRPADKPGHRTEMEYLSLVFDEPVDDAFFSTRNLQTGR
jgi:outer membrane lipoprotein-sorting protein